MKGKTYEALWLTWVFLKQSRQTFNDIDAVNILWKQTNHDSKTKDAPKHQYGLVQQLTNTCIDDGLFN